MVRRPARRLFRRGRRWLACAALLVAVALGGCGPMIYSVNVMPAARVVHQAEEAGAAEHAPYEYHYARAHLEQARHDAGEAAYQDAIHNAKIAEEYGVKARDLARRRMREQGR
jgi:hypothetical protein